jgi:hypothetical protein
MITSLQSDLAYLQKKKDEEKVGPLIYLVFCFVMVISWVPVCWLELLAQALKELKAKAQKGAIGGSGLKKSGKKWAVFLNT